MDGWMSLTWTQKLSDQLNLAHVILGLELPHVVIECACSTIPKSSTVLNNKKAQLSLTNPRNTQACQKLLQFDVLTQRCR